MRSSRLWRSLALGALAFALALVITAPPGPGLDPDGMSYTFAATTLVRGGALRDVEHDWESPDSTQAFTHWPPGFPALIAIPTALGLRPVQGARVIIALSAFASVALATWLVSGAAGTIAAVVAALVLLATPAMAIVHESVLSEPAFIACMLATVALMTRARARPLATGVAAAAASLVRYAGVSLVGAAALWAFWSPGRLRERLGRAALAALPAAIALGAWVHRSVRAQGAESIRTFSVYGELAPTLREGWATFSAAFAPTLRAPWGTLVAITVIVLLVAVAWRAVQSLAVRDDAAADAPRTLLAALALTAASYTGLVLVSRIVADPGIPLDERILAPLLVLLELGVVVAAAVWWKEASRGRRVVAGAMAVAWWAGSLAAAWGTAAFALETGNDIAAECWRESPTVEWVRQHAARRPLFTNVIEPLYFHGGRLARELPDDTDAATLRAFADTLAARRGLIVAFDQSCMDIDSADSIVARLPVRPVARLEDGTVYEAAP